MANTGQTLKGNPKFLLVIFLVNCNQSFAYKLIFKWKFEKAKAAVPEGSILGPTLFLLYINDLPDNVVCNIAIYADDTTLYSKCDQASDL